MTDSKFTLFLIIFVWIATFLALDLMAQDVSSNGRMAGMAYSADALMNGVDAINSNPAMLPLPKGSHVSFSVLPFSFQAGTDFFDFATYKKYFTGVVINGLREPYYLNEVDKLSILSAFRGGVGTFNMHTNFQLFAASVDTPIGALAFSMTDKIVSGGTIPRDYFDFLLYGNTPGQNFDFSKTRIVSSWTRDYSITYAKRININPKRHQSISFGAAAKYIHGYGYFEIDRFDSHFKTDPDSFVVSGTADMHASYAGTEWLAARDVFLFQLFPNPVGHGLGIDVGFQAEFSEYFRVGVSLVDIGAMTWNRTAREINTSENFSIENISSDEQIQEIKNRLNGTEYAVSSFSTELPTVATLSIAYSAYRFLGSERPLHLAFAIRQGFNNYPGNSTDPRVSIGSEWEFLESIPFRAGLSVGGNRPTLFSFGLGLKMDAMTMNIATNHIETLFSSAWSSASFAVSTRFDF